METKKQNISIIIAIIIFTIFTAHFYFLIQFFLPLLKKVLSIHTSVYWYLTGYLLFIPIFLLAVILCRKEGFKSFGEILTALNIKKFTKKDFKYAVISLILCFVFSGVIFLISKLLHINFGFKELNFSADFLEFTPYVGTEKLFLFIWIPMWFFNIVGEEILWRGYIQNRLKGKYSWLIISILWLIFHLPFGIGMVIMLIPICIILPYTFSKTKNTLVGIFIHALFNGPIFVVISLGLLKM